MDNYSALRWRTFKVRGEIELEAKRVHENYFRELCEESQAENTERFRTHDNLRVIIFEDNTHILKCESSIPGIRQFSWQRARRLSWIHYAIEESKSGSGEVTVKDVVDQDRSTNSERVLKRYYIVPQYRYLLVLLHTTEGKLKLLSQHRVGKDRMWAEYMEMV